MDLKHVSCNLCGSDQAIPFLMARDRGWGSFSLVQCVECGLVYTNPRPSVHSIGQYYPDWYYSYRKSSTGLASDLKWLITQVIAEEYWGYDVTSGDKSGILGRIPRWMWRGLAWWYRHKLCRLPPYHPSGKVLDVGCGNGSYLDHLRRLGWEVRGVEIAQRAVETARQQFGIDVFCGALEEAHFPNEHFDAVTLWHVLEHLHSPLESLREIRRILLRGGHLLLTVPNIASAQASLFGDKWIHLDLPRHLYFFTPATMRAMLDKAGFTVEGMSLVSAPHCMSQSLDYTWSDWNRTDIERLNKTLRVFDDIVSLPLVTFFDIVGRGDVIFVRAQKD